jgi:PKD repeat protein
MQQVAVGCRQAGGRLAVALAALIVVSIATPRASAADRKFLVKLATSPKQEREPCLISLDCVPFLGGNGICVPRLVDPFGDILVGECLLPCDDTDECVQNTVLGAAYVCGSGVPFDVPGNVCRFDLENPENIRRRYFVDPDSFAEYWKEVSYGDVTVSGRTTEWLELPWRFVSVLQLEHQDLEEVPDGHLQAGAGELYGTGEPSIDVDLHRGPLSYATGSGGAVWGPGERFVDMDDDGVWDGLDEATNQMDFFAPCVDAADCAPFGPSLECREDVCVMMETDIPVPDGVPDNLGPWIDLNEDDLPANDANCVYVRDSDNDFWPDCCPQGPSRPGQQLGCLPYGEGTAMYQGEPTDPTQRFNNNPDTACPPTVWTLPNGEVFNDCNGNLIPDECDISCASAECAATEWLDDRRHAGLCGGSPDRLPLEEADEGEPCDPAPDGIPDECQWQTFHVDCGAADSTCGDVCEPVEVSRATVPRCEFDDVNNNTVLDVVEPFENYLYRVPGDAEYEPYVRKHFRGDDNRILAQRDARTLTARHDPLNKLPAGTECLCGDGEACGPGKTCVAGEHAQFDPPDSWEEGGSAKMEPTDTVAFPPQPEWYAQAWFDRFGTTAPPWTSIPDSGGGTRGARRLDLLECQPFTADRGGSRGDGTGWFDCGNTDANAVVFDSVDGNFRTDCEPHRILPEELAIPPDEIDCANPNPDFPRIFYDGPREFHDLPSSKYHSSGDLALGEAISPFTDSIWGGGNVAAGPYATHVHGNFGFPAGNMLHLEELTFYDAVSGAGDGTLDGFIDQGEYIINGRHSYEFFGGRRLIEDLIETLDEIIDFDDWVDRIAKSAVVCAQGPVRRTPPFPLSAGGVLDQPVEATGVLSGVVLIPPLLPTDFASGFGRPQFLPVHNEDGLQDPNYPDTDLPRGPRDASQQPDFQSRVSWNLFVHAAVRTNASGNRVTAACRAYLDGWEDLPSLHDPGPGLINCPIGFWDIMAGRPVLVGLDFRRVHPIAPLKERSCPRWVEPVDLLSVLTPGLTKTLTLPPYEFVRDNSVFYLENAQRPGERYYFWSAGEGFDARLPGPGMLIVHSDTGANPDAIPPDQRSATRPSYLVVQADGEDQLPACTLDGNAGDAGDAWPGSTGATQFGFDSIPAAEWYTENLWTGLDITDIVPDGSGSTRVEITWVPTTIPGLQFLVPPGGTSVRISPTNVRYKVHFRATDVFGGTTIRLYYTADQRRCGGTGAACTTNADCGPTQTCRHDVTVSSANFIGELRKTTAGTNELSIDWNIAGVPDGRYVLFAELIPGAGADGTERAFTVPRAGRNNIGNGTFGSVVVNNAEHKARFETWTIVNIDATAGKWLVSSSLSQPEPVDPADAPPSFIATTGLTYTSVGGGLQFRITGGSTSFEAGDRFSLTTTGITAVSAGVRIDAGTISEDPRAVIVASPLSGPPPLTVDFDGRGSRDPNGDPLQYRWDFGDGTPTASSAVVSHTYSQAGDFTAVLRVTNTRTGRFGESSVDISVVNNSPKAVIRAEPSSGPPNLTVRFDGAESSDQETPSNQLVYQWNFGDGTSANDEGRPGVLIQTDHFYSRRADGTTCTTVNPCSFTATLTVTDTGGKSDSATVKIQVGNTNPVANVVAGPLQGPAPLTVRFNAGGSFDADGDPLTVDWTWGDGQTTNNAPIAGPAGDGVIEHQYTDQGDYTPTAVIKDGRGGQAAWPGVTITVGPPIDPSEGLRALFTVSPARPVAGVAFTANASASTGNIVSYGWDWGDQTADSSGVQAMHTYAQPGSYRVTLTVTDNQNHTAVSSQVVVVTTESGETPEENQRPVANIVVVPATAEALVGELFTFNGSGSNDPDDDPLTYQWTFGDGSAPVSGGEQVVQVTHAYSAPGQFLVRLTVRDPSNAVAEATRAVRVLSVGENRRPIPVIATGPRTGTVGATIIFDGSASYDPDEGDDLTYMWTFQRSGQTIATQMGAVVSQRFGQAGTYAVYLTVTDEAGASTTSDAETVVISVATDVEPPDDGGPGDGGTGRPQPPDSANQRPSTMCGLGMLPAMFASLLTLSAVRARRRRRI